MHPGEHLGEDDAERELIGPAVERRAEQLLRRHVARGADDQSVQGEARARAQLAGVALEVRQPEVEDLHAPVGEAEHVLGLEVAMDDALAMGGLESRGEPQRDAERFLARQRSAAHHVAQRLAVQVLAGDVGPAVDFLERVDGRDVGMDERGGRPGFASQPLLLGAGPAERGHRLQGHPAVQPRVLGLEHDAHAAAAEHPHQPIGAEHRAGLQARRQQRVARLDRRLGGRRIEEPVRAGVGGEQRLDLAPHVVGGPGRRQPGGARLTRLVERACEQLPHFAPALRGHAAPSSAFLRNARASVQWRFTVAGESSTAAAVSSTVRPPK